MITPNIRLAAIVAIVSFASGIGASRADAPGIDVSQQPLFTTAGKPPLMMMVMSRDEQLFIKAYTDFTDLHAGEAGDAGVANTTYDDTFDYTGYFGPNLCYSYNSGLFKADNAAGGANNHSCSAEWSGNFLNWVTMTRLDIVRSVLYGGLRSTDVGGTTPKTVLERAAVPNDVHAWAKVYSGADISSYTPFSGTMTFCNASYYNNSGYPATPPQMRVAQGDYSQWAATERHQCVWRNDGLTDPTDGPNSTDPGSAAYNVRVDVCNATNSTLREPFCRKYTNATGDSTYKPAGLLQEYGENGSIRFGLMTGSYADPRSGGRLRRNIGLFAGNSGTQTNGCAAGDEVNTSDGTFCNQTAGTEGIVNTLSRLELAGWSGESSGNGWYAALSGNTPDCARSSSYQWGIINRDNPSSNGGWLDNPGGTAPAARHCNAWGNPLSEIYAEAVRYIEGNGNAPTSGFVSGDDMTYVPGIPDKIDWIDPYGEAQTDAQGGNGGGNQYCATCSILVLSTGLNSFDSDEIPADSRGINAATATDAVGADEAINGGDYLIGRVLGSGGSPASLTVGTPTDTATDVCTGKVVSSLSNAIGLCPDIPSLEGSYYIAGLAYKAWTTDLRPDLIGTGPDQKPATYLNKVKTFSVALAESLPNFAISVAGSTINFSPLCVANPDSGKQLSDGGFHACSLAALTVGGRTATKGPNYYTYGRALMTDGSAGSYSITWEDSTFGSDHDQDAVEVLTYCVGSSCSYQSPQTIAGARKNIDGTVFSGYDICWRSDSTLCTSSGGTPTVAPGQMLMRVEVLATSTGDTMATGFSISGTASGDGANAITRAWGNSGTTNILTGQVDPPTAWDLPKVMSFTPGTSSVKRLQNPLWYAAKYGSFDDSVPGVGQGNGKPDPGEWDKDQSGTPDNFFQVTDPSKLKAELEKIFNQALTDAAPTASVATSTPRFVNGATLAYEASFNANRLDRRPEGLHDSRRRCVYRFASGVEGERQSGRPGAANRNIFTSTPETVANSFNGHGINFDTANLTPAMQTSLLNGLDPAVYNIGEVVAYLRGDQTNEADQTPPGPYRTRSSIIGDVLNSSPAVSGVTSYGYGQLLANVAPTAAASYVAFVTSKKAIYGDNSENPVVFFGANDGMFHALDGSNSTTGGNELFAYVPNEAIKHMGELVKPSYTHRYFVDGSPTVTDAYLGAWKTVLVSSTGAGSRSVFALDVTDPSAFRCKQGAVGFQQRFERSGRRSPGPRHRPSVGRACR